MKVALYMHGGSGNHGCEALVRTVSEIFGKVGSVTLFSKEPDEDKRYISNINVVSCGNAPSKYTLPGFVSAVRVKYMNQQFAFVKPAYSSLLKFVDKDTVAVSIGGDNYCYDGMPQVMAILNSEIKKRGAKSVLFGCSIEPELLKDDSVVKDLSNYDLITARETITYNALIDAGVNTKIMLVPDSAFMLSTDKRELPEGFIDGNTVGINISPLVISCEDGKSVLLDAYCRMIEYIIEKTNMQIALIPHVVWSNNNDNEPIDVLFNKYSSSGRVIRINDCSAPELKGYISRCRFFVGARTHSTIAAYSSFVPTLVIGYSVKSKGIAKDLFGTDANYVKNVKDIKKDTDITESFMWLMDHEREIKEHLNSIMKDYIKNVKELEL